MLSKLQTLKEEREQGFTLIELLVVILIIGILSAIAIPAFMNQRKSAVDSSVASDVSNAAKQVETLAIKAGASGGAVSVTGAAGGNHVITVGANSITMDTSDGTSLRVNGNTGTGYWIQGTNPGGDVSAKAPVAAPNATTGTGYIYDSLSGGLKVK